MELLESVVELVEPHGTERSCSRPFAPFLYNNRFQKVFRSIQNICAWTSPAKSVPGTSYTFCTYHGHDTTEC